METIAKYIELLNFKSLFCKLPSIALRLKLILGSNDSSSWGEMGGNFLISLTGKELSVTIPHIIYLYCKELRSSLSVRIINNTLEGRAQ